MALRQPFAVKNFVGNVDIEIEAKPGQSLLITDIRAYNPAQNFITLKTDKTTVGYFRSGGYKGEHLPFPKYPGNVSTGFKVDALTISSVEYNKIIDAGGNALDLAFAAETDVTAETTFNRVSVPERVRRPQKTLLRRLRELGIMQGYPIAEGETFRIENMAQAGAYCQVIYQIYDREDIKNTDPNGSKAHTYTIVSYADTGATISAAGDNLYDNPLNPAEFPAFPFGKTVPAKTKAKIHGICHCPVTAFGSSTSNYIYSTYLKLISEREVLFDEDRNGLLLYGLSTPAVANLYLIGEGLSEIHECSATDAGDPLIFDTPLEYDEGDELNIYLTTAIGGAGADLITQLQQIALIITFTRKTE